MSNVHLVKVNPISLLLQDNAEGVLASKTLMLLAGLNPSLREISLVEALQLNMRDIVVVEFKGAAEYADPMFMPFAVMQNIEGEEPTEAENTAISYVIRREVAKRMGFNYSDEEFLKARLLMSLELGAIEQAESYEEEGALND